MSDREDFQVLQRLYRITQAGEKGFATAAANMPDPAIKVLLRYYAQQRAAMKEEILALLSRMERPIQPRASLPGMIHRGRVAIFARMSGDAERQKRSILKEAALGERFAVQEYERAGRASLSGDLGSMVSRHLALVRAAAEQISMLRGREGRRAVVHAFTDQGEAGQAAQALRQAGFPLQSVQETVLQEDQLYQGHGASIRETVLSGAFGGALWGGLTGILVGFGVLQTSYVPQGAAALAWLLAVLGSLLVGAIIATPLAFFIGADISEDDAYQSQNLAQASYALVTATVEADRAAEAGKIMGLRDPQLKGGVFKTIP